MRPPPWTAALPPFMRLHKLGGLYIACDPAGSEELEVSRAEYTKACREASANFTFADTDQPPIWLHGKQGLWRFGYDKKLRDDGVDLGNVETGISYWGDMPVEDGTGLLGVILINAAKTVEVGVLTSLLQMGLEKTSVADVAAALDGFAERPPSWVAALPPFMRLHELGGLYIACDPAASEELEASRAEYTEACREASANFDFRNGDQPPIWLHGKQGLWRFGYDTKLRDDGLDLGDVEKGIIYWGNMSYEDGTELDGIMLINAAKTMEAGILIDMLQMGLEEQERQGRACCACCIRLRFPLDKE